MSSGVPLHSDWTNGLRSDATHHHTHLFSNLPHPAPLPKKQKIRAKATSAGKREMREKGQRREGTKTSVNGHRMKENREQTRVEQTRQGGE